jgi:hypothetical protein
LLPGQVLRVPDAKCPAASVDLGANAAYERRVFVFDDQLLIVGDQVVTSTLQRHASVATAMCQH